MTTKTKPKSHPIPEGFPWPDWLTDYVLKGAYLPRLFASGRPPERPLAIKAFQWDGRWWVQTGGVLSDDWDAVYLLPLATVEEFAERWPGIALRLAPGLPEEPTAEDRESYYRGVQVRVGRRLLVIMPASEGRTVVRRKEASHA